MKFKHLFRRGLIITFCVVPLVRCFVNPAVKASLKAGYLTDPNFIPYFKAHYMEIWFLSANSPTVVPSYNLYLLSSIALYVGLAAAGATLLAVATLGRRQISERFKETTQDEAQELVLEVPPYESTEKLSEFGEESWNGNKFLPQTALAEHLRPKVTQLQTMAEDLIRDAHQNQPPDDSPGGKTVQLTDAYQDGAIIQLSQGRRKASSQDDKVVETVEIFGEAALIPANFVGQKSNNPQISRREPLTDSKKPGSGKAEVSMTDGKAEVPVNSNKMEINKTDPSGGLVEVYLTKKQVGDIVGASIVPERLQKGVASEWATGVFLNKSLKFVQEVAELSVRVATKSTVVITELVLTVYGERLVDRLLAEFGVYIWLGFGMILFGVGGLAHLYYTFPTPAVDPNNVIYLLPDADVFMIRLEQTTNAVYKALLQSFLPHDLRELVPMSDAETQLVKDFVIKLKNTHVTFEEVKIILKSLQKK